MAELAAAVLSIDGPYIDLSNPAKLYEQTELLHKYEDEKGENFPMVFASINAERMEMVANDRYEIASEIDISVIDISVIYKIDPQTERITDGVQRGRDCLAQIAKRLAARQTGGEALLPLYPSGDIDIDATADYGVDHGDADLVNAAATARFTVKQIQIKEVKDAS
jgi:hypothetical protein